MHPIVRIGLVVVLVAGSVGAAVHYADERRARASYVDGAELAEEGEAVVGERAYLWTDVVAVTDAGVVVETGGREVLITGVTATVEPGDVLQVYGVVESPDRVAADRTVVAEPVGVRYMFAVSTLAALLVAGTVLRHWRPDVRTLTLRRRP